MARRGPAPPGGRGDRDVRRLALLLAAALLGPAGLAGCAGPSPPPSSRATPAHAVAAVRPPGEDADPDESPDPTPAPAPAPAYGAPEPPDGRWLRDEAGREYFVERLPRARAVRLDARTVRTAWGVTVDVVREDDQYYYYKLYRVLPGPPPRPAGPSAEERARIAASYRIEVVESARLAFVPFDRGLPKVGQWRDGFAVADLDGDGRLDVVLPPARKTLGSPVVFLGDGQGGWRPWGEARFPPLPYDYGDVRVGDLDGDGHPDLVLAVHLRGLIALLGDGRGGFTAAGAGLDFAARPGEPVFSSRAIRLLDWNGDGRLDILALGEGPRLMLGPGRPGDAGSQGVVVYLNALAPGGGAWRRYDQGTGSGRLFGSSLAVGDFDGDGRLDFATGSSVLGRQDLVHLARGDGGWTTVAVEPVRPRAYVRAVAAADFDGDGRADLAVGYLSHEAGVWRTGIDVLLARPGGGWERRGLAAETGRRGVWALATGDLDGDGHRDLVALTGTGDLWVFPGDGRGGFTRERTTGPPFGGGCRGAHVALADLDGDGRDEVIAAFADEAGSEAPRRCPSQGGVAAWKPVRR